MQNGEGIGVLQCGMEENRSDDPPALLLSYWDNYGFLLRHGPSDESSQSSGPAPTASGSSTVTPVLLQEDSFHSAMNTPIITESTTLDLHPRPAVNSATRRETAHRRHFSRVQRAHLEAFFQKCRQPDYVQRLQLAEDIGVDKEDEKRVQVWFKNRRFKQYRTAGMTPDAPAKRPRQPAESVSSNPVESSSTSPLAPQPSWIPGMQDGFQFQCSDQTQNVLRLIMPDPRLTMPGVSPYWIWETVKDDVAAVNAGLPVDLQRPVDPPVNFVPLTAEPGWIYSNLQPSVQTSVMEGNMGYSMPESDTRTLHPDRTEQSPGSN